MCRQARAYYRSLLDLDRTVLGRSITDERAPADRDADRAPHQAARSARFSCRHGHMAPRPERALGADKTGAPGVGRVSGGAGNVAPRASAGTTGVGPSGCSDCSRPARRPRTLTDNANARGHCVQLDMDLGPVGQASHLAVIIRPCCRRAQHLL